MLHSLVPEQISHAIVERIRALAPRFGDRAADAEEARQLPAESIEDLIEAGVARILVPRRFGGYGLGFETWFDVVREIGKADASHAWCASIIIHHAHIIGLFPEEAQKAVWAEGPNVAIAASIMPTAQVKPADGGYLVSGQQSAFASGIGHSSWAMVGGFVHEKNAPEWTLFLIPPGRYEVRDTWFTVGMRATGSNTIVTNAVFVPSEHTLKISDLRDGCSPGAWINEDPIFQVPFRSYAGLTFAAPMLGAAQGAYEHFRTWTKTRKGMGGVVMAEVSSVQVRMARAAANLDAADFLLRRAAQLSHASEALPSEQVARSVRDFARASELIVEAIDMLIALSGTAGYATAHPLQRAWRDIHFASMHVALNTENNYAHFGRTEFGLVSASSQPFF